MTLYKIILYVAKYSKKAKVREEKLHVTSFVPFPS